jgi:hypothetical protein
MESVLSNVCRKCKPWLSTLEDHKGIRRKVLRQTLSVCGCNCWSQDKREKEFHGYSKAVCVMDRDRGSKLMALNTPNTSANAVPDGEYLNLVVHGIEELNKKNRHVSC